MGDCPYRHQQSVQYSHLLTEDWARGEVEVSTEAGLVFVGEVNGLVTGVLGVLVIALGVVLGTELVEGDVEGMLVLELELELELVVLE